MIIVPLIGRHGVQAGWKQLAGNRPCSYSSSIFLKRKNVRHRAGEAGRWVGMIRSGTFNGRAGTWNASVARMLRGLGGWKSSVEAGDQAVSLRMANGIRLLILVSDPDAPEKTVAV